MAKTKDEWYSILKSWVPEWFFQKEIYSGAVFKAIAQTLRTLELDNDEIAAQTFVTRAAGSYLDLLGSERGVYRISNELDAQYSIRIQNKSLVSQISKPQIKALVDQLIIQGVCQIKEDFEGGVFASRGAYANRAEIIISPLDNTFNIVVDKQLHDPYSFANRSAFAGRRNFVGTIRSSDYVFQLISSAVTDNKALGVFYRILERLQ